MARGFTGAARLIAAAAAVCVLVSPAQSQFSNSDWTNAVNEYKCTHGNYTTVAWSTWLYEKAEVAAAQNSICGDISLDTNVLFDNTAATNPNDETQVYYDFTYIVGVHSTATSGATAADMIRTIYTQGYAACTAGNNTMPGCSDKTVDTVTEVVDNDDTDTDTSAPDATTPFIHMMSSNVRYMAAYKCPTLLRYVIAFKGANDVCSTDCSTCNAIGQSQCNDALVTDLNASASAGDCLATVENLADSPAENQGDGDNNLSNWAIAGIVLLCLLLVLIAVAVYRHRDLLRSKMRIGYSNEFRSKEGNATRVATARKNTHMHMAERARSINHSASSKIMNPHIDVLPSTGGPGQLPEVQKSAAEHLSAEDFLRVALKESKEQDLRKRNTTGARGVRFDLPMSGADSISGDDFIGESTL